MPTPSDHPRANAHRSGYTRDGFAARYDAYRPAPPTALLELLCQVIQTPAPRLVVDLGSGTGRVAGHRYLLPQHASGALRGIYGSPGLPVNEWTAL